MRLLLQGLLATALFSAAPFVSAVEFTHNQSARISHMVGKVLEEVHYRGVPLDDSVSEKFLRNYLDALDYNHLIFLKSDVEEFQTKYGKKLDDYIVPKDPKTPANVRPANEIFNRYLLRLGERNAFTAKILKENFPQPWRCHGAMQLLARIASMPEEFKTDFNNAPYPNLSTPQARQHFINTYLPEIHTRLTESGASPEARLAAQ